MNKLLQFALALFLCVLGFYIFNAMASFFNIGFQEYGFYMFFGVGLLLLYFVLPRKMVNIFE